MYTVYRYTASIRGGTKMTVHWAGCANCPNLHTQTLPKILPLPLMGVAMNNDCSLTGDNDTEIVRTVKPSWLSTYLPVNCRLLEQSSDHKDPLVMVKWTAMKKIF